ncbi:MAG: hypothetical protein RLO81_12455 [Fulvivirga sp.]|uniref:hypothetical protein n=1 Tax=Fulvivirga sp. TaxID=1931237 RepID=UPI0032EB69FD
MRFNLINLLIVVFIFSCNSDDEGSMIGSKQSNQTINSFVGFDFRVLSQDDRVFILPGTSEFNNEFTGQNFIELEGTDYIDTGSLLELNKSEGNMLLNGLNYAYDYVLCLTYRELSQIYGFNVPYEYYDIQLFIGVEISGLSDQEVVQVYSRNNINYFIVESSDNIYSRSTDIYGFVFLKELNGLQANINGTGKINSSGLIEIQGAMNGYNYIDYTSTYIGEFELSFRCIN